MSQHARNATSTPTLIALALMVALASGNADAQRKKKAPAAPVVSAECTDFYNTANLSWLTVNTLPPGTGSVTALGQLRELSLNQQRELLDAAMQSPQGTVQQLLGDFWASGLDEAALERDGSNAIAPLLARINAMKRTKDVAPAVAALHQVGIPVLFNFSSDVDVQDLDRHIGYFMQGGTGLGDPAYYTRTDAETAELLGLYRAYVRQILALTGTPAKSLEAETQTVIEIETRIAQASRPLLQLREPASNYAPVATAGLGKQFNNLQLDAFLKAQGVTDDMVSMANPELFQELDALVGSVKPAQWKTYLRWQVGDAMAPHLSKSFRDAAFEFRGRVLRGEAAPAPRWQQTVQAINTAAGPMLGREYAARYLPAASKEKAEAVAGQVRDALGRGIERNAWMSPETRAEAKAKLAALRIEVGTPPRDLEPSTQPMGRGSFAGNVLIASTWRHSQEMKRIGNGNADRRWHVLPQEPALTYDLAHNRLIVTAAALQPPIFDIDRAEPAIYGSFGALVGHELSRGFDSNGRKVDARGQVRDWWTPADATAWEQIASRVSLQYSGYPYPALTGTNVNGTLTRNENMADLAGVELALDAFGIAQPQAQPDAGQALFRAWSELWAQQLSPAEAAQRAATDVHAPGQWRANGPLANQPAFGDAYKCTPGQPMRRAEADEIRIWR